MGDIKLKIGEIGETVNAESVERLRYFSNRNFSDFDVLLIRTSALAAELADISKMSHRIEYPELDEMLETAKGDFAEFLDHGGLAFVFVDRDPKQRWGQALTDFQLSYENELSLVGLDHEKFSLHYKSGNEFGPMYELEEFGKHFGFKYRFLWDEVDGTGMIKTKRGAKGFAAFRKKVGAGYVYGLPEAGYRPLFNSSERATFNKVLKDLIEATRKIDSDSLTVPDWANEFVFGDEGKYADLKKELERERAELDERIGQNEKDLKKFIEIKSLIFAGDAVLEQCVEDVFREFGFNVTVPEGNKDDLNILEDDFKAVVEIKGSTKSASTAHVMQLEKWATNYGLANGIMPKAILVVNAFKDVPIKDRKGKVFPRDLLEFSIPRKHCLLQTIDLLHLYVDFKAELISKEEIKQLLSDTVGVLKYEVRLK